MYPISIFSTSLLRNVTNLTFPQMCGDVILCYSNTILYYYVSIEFEFVHSFCRVEETTGQITSVYYFWYHNLFNLFLLLLKYLYPVQWYSCDLFDSVALK